jgi:hypothetical protein
MKDPDGAEDTENLSEAERIFIFFFSFFLLSRFHGKKKVNGRNGRGRKVF